MIGVGVLGCGYWGPKLIRNLAATDGFRMAAACDPKEGRRAFVRQHHPEVEVTADPEELFARPDIQAVWIATPVPTHRTFARRALEAGKHVMVEKPLATSLEDAAGLASLARARGLTLQTGHTFLFSPAVKLLRKLMAEAAIGRTCYLSSERINPGPPHADVNVLWDLAVHDVAIILDLVGRRPESVAARGRCYLRGDVPEAVFMNVEFGHGVSANVHVSWMSAQKTRVLKLFGTEATLIYDDLAPAPVRFIGAPVDNRKRAGDTEVLDLAYAAGDVRDYRPEGPEPLRAECEAFLEEIRSGEPAPNAGSRAVEVIETLEAAQRSMMAGGRPVAIAGRGSARTSAAGFIR